MEYFMIHERKKFEHRLRTFRKGLVTFALQTTFLFSFQKVSQFFNFRVLGFISKQRRPSKVKRKEIIKRPNNDIKRLLFYLYIITWVYSTLQMREDLLNTMYHPQQNTLYPSGFVHTENSAAQRSTEQRCATRIRCSHTSRAACPVPVAMVEFVRTFILLHSENQVRK